MTPQQMRARARTLARRFCDLARTQHAEGEPHVTIGHTLAQELAGFLLDAAAAPAAAGRPSADPAGDALASHLDRCP